MSFPNAFIGNLDLRLKHMRLCRSAAPLHSEMTLRVRLLRYARNDAPRMIQDPISITVILAAIVIVAERWHERFKNTLIMRILPTPVFCYIPPTILTTLGIFPMKSLIYDWISKYVLPACLILLLMTTDLSNLKKVGRVAFLAMIGACVTVVMGGILVFFLFHNVLGPESWKAIGTLTASWVGGTANELAVKEATGLSDALFGPLFISDITIVYIWMMFLMILSGNQKKINKIIGADRKSSEKIVHHQEKSNARKRDPKKTHLKSLIILLIIGFGGAIISSWIGNQIPEIGLAVNRATWVVIVVTTVGLVLSMSKYIRSEEVRATKIGYFLLYFVLASTGAKANLLAILMAPLFLGIAFIWMLIHGVLFFFFGKLFRMPIAILATASQAALGGVVSAPIVASTYGSELISVGLILAIFGNAMGNYAGILMSQFLRLFAA